MADKRNFTALEWVSGEIGETLKQAAELLEAYASNKEDSTRIRFCLNHIHQVHNILEMVELYGGALLAEEMEKLSRSLIEKNTTNTSDAIEVLMRAILQLPLYLDRVKTLRTDDPASLMALLNDLRAVRGENLFTETQLFSPDMRPARSITGPRVRLTEEKFAEIIHKLRQGYESAMVKVLRDRNIDDSIPILKKVFENFKKICQGTARSALWDVCLATLEGIENDTIPGSIAINNLLRQVDKEIRHMAHGGSATLDEFTPEELIKNLLYYIARSTADSPIIQAIHEAYKLDRALPGMGNADGTLGAAEPDAMRSVVVAVCEEFAKVKSIFDMLAANTLPASEGVPATIAIFKQTGDTLAVLGLGDLRRKLEHINTSLQKSQDADNALSADTLMDAAAMLLEVETVLNERYNRHATPASDGSPQSMDHAISSAQESVLLECHNGLEQVKDAIVEYIASQWDKSRITGIPDILQAVRGGLEIVGQRRAARVLGACSRYIKEKLLDAYDKPDFADMDSLADAMASVEYYLECLDEDVVEDTSETLTIAERSVAALGYAVTAHARSTAAQFIDEDHLEIESLASPAASAEETAELVARLHEEEDTLVEMTPVESAAASPTLSNTELHLPSLEEEKEEAVTDVTSLEAEGTQDTTPVSPTPVTIPVPTPTTASKPTVPATADVLPEDSTDDLVVEDLDDEIAEIFIEEAEEVMETIREYYPLWRSNFADAASLTEFRRGFHTLKGSGRMAKALQLGELAWSVENMLNRIIDGTIEANEAVCTIIDKVIDKLPSMIQAFSQRKVDPQPALSQRLYNAAIALSKGEPMPSLEAPAALPESTITSTADGTPSTPIDAIEDTVTTDAEPDTLEPEVLDEVADSDDEPALATTDTLDMAPIDLDALEDMDPDFDYTLWEIFASEAEMHLEVADEWIAFARERSPLPVETSDPLQRALHTLKGSAHMAEVTPIAELATPFEKFVKELRAYQIKVDDTFTDLLTDMVAEIRLGIAMIEKQKRVVLPHSQQLLDRTSILRLQLTGGGDVEATSKTDAPPPELATVDPSRFNAFLVTDMDALMHVAPLLDAWEQSADNSGLERIVWELEEMAAGATLAGLEPIAALARAIAPCYAHAQQTHSGFAAWRPLAELAHDALIDFMDRMAASEDLVPNTDMESRCTAFLTTVFEDTDDVAAPLSTPADTSQLAEEASDVELEASAELLAMAFGDELLTAHAPPIIEDVMDEEIELLTLAEEAPLLAASSEDYLGTGTVDALEPETAAFPTVDELDAFTAEDTLDLPIVEELATEELPVVEELSTEELPVVEELTTEELSAEALLAMEALVAEEEKREEAVPAPADSQAAAAQPAAGGVLDYSDDLEPELLDIFLEEANDLAEELEGIISDWQASPEDGHFADALRRNLHTLKGGARMSGLTGLGSLAHDLETQLEQFSGMADSALFADILQYQDCILAGIEQGRALAAGQAPVPMTTPLPGMAAAAPTLPIVEDITDFPLVEELVVEADSTFDLPMAEELPIEADTTALEPEAATPPTNETADAIEDVTAITAALDPDAAPTMIRPAVFLGDTTPPPRDDSIRPLYPTSPVDTDIPVAVEVPVITDSVALAETELTHTEAVTPAVDLGMSTDIDAELLGIFIDEADELLEDLDTQVRGWQADPAERSFCDALKRTLHTYKGGARMAGIMGLGELAHDLESQLEQFNGTADDVLFATVHQYQDKLITGTNWIRRIAAGETLDQILGVKTTAQPEPTVTPAIPTTASLPDTVSATREATAITPAMTPEHSEAPATAVILPFRGGVLPTGLAEAAEGKRYGQTASDSKAAQAQQEMIKVSADLLESLVNLAGETSINRSRVEQQMNDIRYSANDMDGTINRLQDLLRRLKSETDAQIQSRISEMQERSDDFDPLEMDRYSTLQQLTSSLSESASDLIDIRNSLNNKLRDTETLLIQQSRINTDLQEGLMRSRMVPFSRLEPRLRRIVRQVAGELKKEISFDLENVQGELDRTMLERMVAPLEHMLRNACDHGVETPEKRVAAGKSRQGRIVLSLGREGGDILISLRDDGGGINVDAVKRKAIERGLMNPDAPLTDSEVLQFILQAGFSTAEKVTQISGRGVGMDVVNSEIKQMGGNMTIHSAVGKGSEFVIRLPFTVSVNRALMVRTGEELYAVPLNSIEGIVRVSPFELESYYDDPTAQFEYAERHYQVRYLGALLHTKTRPNLEGVTLPEPVILLRGTDHTVALHVDQLVGSREIVVKSLGSQFSSVPGLSGATLLGDGSVVPILDLPGLVRASFALPDTAVVLSDESAEPTIQETITVMVCDDSVTVRKVTSRLLEREGYDVMLAKDGADALLQMQDKMPDVLLLDIEMPRMDGFEVASSMKGSPRLQDIPIIMITSRTGEKHRERALAMGVERYMGKPFVEDELLMNINDLVGERLARRMARYERSGGI